MIYLASPYSHKDKRIVEKRVQATQRLIAALAQSGYSAISPICHWHEIAKRHKLPTDWLYWLEYNHHLMDLCQELLVFQYPGWKKSKGMKDEIKYAKKKKYRIRYVVAGLPFISAVPLQSKTDE